jgi:hypothetical protein
MKLSSTESNFKQRVVAAVKKIASKDNSILFVRWVDSSSQEGWKSGDNIDTELLQCVSVGFLVKETKKSIVISGHRTEQFEPDYDGIIVIPRSAILKIKKIKIFG